MKKTIFTIPNIISVARVLIFLPITLYFLFKGENLWMLAASFMFFLSDMLDGFIARRFNMITKLGTHLDAWGDSIFLAAITLSMLYLGYLDWSIIALMAAQRFTRLFVVLYFYFYHHGYYNPKRFKIVAEVIFIYGLFAPLIADYIGRENTITIIKFLIYATYLPFIASVISTFKKAGKGQIKITKFK